MRSFEHVRVHSVDEALEALGDDWSVRVLAGGTDLLHEMKQGTVVPERLVDIKQIPELGRIDGSSGDLSVGALARISTLEEDSLLRARVPMLAQAAAEVASPQLRNMATVAGNVLQRPRCWYYRDRHTVCLRRGGKLCFAAMGDNSRHAIFGAGPCSIVCPSDLAPALVALGAKVEIAGRKGRRQMPLQETFRTPKQDPHRENCLGPADILTGFRIPEPAPGSRGVFLKARERQVWDFALASVAAQLQTDGDGTVTSASIVLGGVAPNPWVAQKAQEILTGETLTEEVCRAAADAAVSEAKAMKHNGYKVDLTRNLVERALAELRR